jgi:hypothetical protein
MTNRRPGVEAIIEDLIVALLSVNSWPVDKTYQMLDALRGAGLTDPTKLAQLTPEEISHRLAAVGYARGDYINGLIGVRLASLGQVLTTERCTALSRSVSERRFDSVNAMLGLIKGVGPMVLRNFWFLRQP